METATRLLEIAKAAADYVHALDHRVRKDQYEALKKLREAVRRLADD